MLRNSPNESYLEIWHQTFTNSEVMADCQNIIMYVFEIPMILPFTNAIVEHVFVLSNEQSQNRLS